MKDRWRSGLGRTRLKWEYPRRDRRPPDRIRSSGWRIWGWIWDWNPNGHQRRLLLKGLKATAKNRQLDTNTNMSPTKAPRTKPRLIPNLKPPIPTPTPRPAEVPTQPTPIAPPQPAQRFQTNVARGEITAPIPLPRMLNLGVGVSGIGPNCDQDQVEPIPVPRPRTITPLSRTPTLTDQPHLQPPDNHPRVVNNNYYHYHYYCNHEPKQEDVANVRMRCQGA